MKLRLLIAAMTTALLAGCETNTKIHPGCAPLQQAEKRNMKDLEAYCFTAETQSSLKCEQAKDERDNLRQVRTRMESAEWQQPGGFGRFLFDACAPVF